MTSRWRRRGGRQPRVKSGDVPAQGALVEVDEAGERWESVVSRASPWRLVLDPLPELVPAAGTEVTLRWTEEGGARRLRCVVEADGTLVPVEPATSLQRRSFVRVPATMRVRLLVGADTYQAEAADVSEGGIRCSIAEGIRLIVGEEVQVALLLGGVHLALAAQVRRTQLRPGGRQEIALAFLGSPSEELRRWILQEQLARRARRRQA